MQKVTDYGIPAVLLSTVMDGDGVWCQIGVSMTHQLVLYRC
jgi:hypothetical protein